MTNLKWTPQAQSIAEVARACGVSYKEIGKVLGVGASTVTRHLIPGLIEKGREQTRRWHKTNPDATREQGRRYYHAHREARLNKNRLWREANSEKLDEYFRCYRETRREYYRERTRLWRENNPGAVKEANTKYYRLRRKTNPEALREYSREINRRWRNANREKYRNHVRARHALRRAAGRRALVPLTVESKQQRFALFADCCAYCGSSNRITVDHVHPLKKGGLDTPSNIVPACLSCNSSKHTSPMEEWFRSQPFFSEDRWGALQRHCPSAQPSTPQAISDSAP
jgi:hypothetical protein